MSQTSKRLRKLLTRLGLRKPPVVMKQWIVAEGTVLHWGGVPVRVIGEAIVETAEGNIQGR